jgi:hypothetical protein
MKYDFSTKYRISVSGTSDEIRILIKELSNQMDKGQSYIQLKNELDDLEKIVELEQYTFGAYHRIYYNHDSLLYIPNVSSKEAQKIHYNIFKKIFDEATKSVEKKR